VVFFPGRGNTRENWYPRGQMGDRVGPSAESTGRNMVRHHESIGLKIARV